MEALPKTATPISNGRQITAEPRKPSIGVAAERRREISPELQPGVYTKNHGKPRKGRRNDRPTQPYQLTRNELPPISRNTSPTDLITAPLERRDA